MRELILQPTFDIFWSEEISPGIDIQSEAEIENAIRCKAITDYHPCGKCALGNNALKVVNFRMQEYGIQHLRVAYTSLFPSVVSGNLNASAMMVAARAADLILEKPQLPDLYTRFKFH